MTNSALNQYYKVFEKAPMAAAILDASDLKLQVVNQSMLALWDRPASIEGTALLDFLPEIADQEYPQILKRVVSTGQAYSEIGAAVILERKGKKETVFMDYSYTPLSMEGKHTSAILVMGTDVCERELNRLIIQQSSRDLRALIMSAPVPMCVFRGREFKIEAVNERMLDLWQGTRTMNLSALNHVFYNGLAYSFSEGNIKYTYTPLWSGIKVVTGVCVMAVKI